ncbi:hypothetical protein [Aquimarina longa]|uniref:hypothetical protein n=1 Tax=Aquimarina longa TaxID=1080221 RepID=UPI00078554C5|nr:hypothetical protein [Aquimarina longa]
MNSIFNILLLLILLINFSCGQKTQATTEMKNKSHITCDNFDCLEKNKNKHATVKGKLRAFTPNKQGKGAGHMFWDWEILIADDVAIPVISKNEKLDLSVYNNKNVLIESSIFYGIVIGDPEGQNATGYRIDAYSIQE